MGLRVALVDMPPIFDAIRDAINTTAYNTNITDLTQRFANIGTFTSLFYTEAENFDTYTKQIVTQLNSLGVALPTTRDGFRALVDSINVVDEATSDQFHGLVALAPAMDAYFKALEQQTEATKQLTMSMLNANRYRTQTDFIMASAFARNGVPLSSLPTENMPSYAVGTSYVPNDGTAMLHRGEAVLTRNENSSLSINTSQMVQLLNRVVSKISELGYDIKRGADASDRSARELEDITGGDIIINTQVV
jgi:hypothetical protein